MERSKSYFNYKDLQRLGLSQNRAYKALEIAMTMPVKDEGVMKPWCETLECVIVNGKCGKRAPVALVAKALPHCLKRYVVKEKDA